MSRKIIINYIIWRTLCLVGVGIGESSSLASFPADQAVQVRSGLVLAASLNGVALGASLDKNL